MGTLRQEIKRLGMAPNQRRNHWKNGVPQNPETLAYKLYHYHLEHPPCSLRDLAVAVGLRANQSHKVKFIVDRMRKAGTWRWQTRADREWNQKRGQRRALGMFGES